MASWYIWQNRHQLDAIASVFYFLPIFVATEKEMFQKISARACRYDSTGSQRSRRKRNKLLPLWSKYNKAEAEQ